MNFFVFIFGGLELGSAPGDPKICYYLSQITWLLNINDSLGVDVFKIPKTTTESNIFKSSCETSILKMFNQASWRLTA